MSEPPPRRFELVASDDKPARFWEIAVVERRCQLRYGALVERAGRIHEQDVETRAESFKNRSVAQVKAKTKIRRKLEAGYVEQSPSRRSASATKEALEQAVCERLDDREAWAVYADFIQHELPELGERIMLELALEDAKAGQERVLFDRMGTLDTDRMSWLGQTMAELSGRRGFGEVASLSWRMGMLDRLRLRSRRIFRPQCSLDAVLTAALASPTSCFMTTLKIEIVGGGRPKEIERAAERLVESGGRPALRTLELDGVLLPGAEAPELPGLERCLAIAPRLESLSLRGRLRPGLPGEHARLRRLTLFCTSDKASWVGRLSGLNMPALKELRVGRAHGTRYTTRAAELSGLFCTAQLPALSELDLVFPNEGNALLEAIAGTPLLDGLRVLSIDGVDNGGAEWILAAPERFAHLERLTLSPSRGRIYGEIRVELRALGNVVFR